MTEDERIIRDDQNINNEVMRRIQRRDNAVQPGEYNVVPRSHPPEIPEVVEASDSEGEEEYNSVENVPKPRRQVKPNRRSR